MPNFTNRVTTIFSADSTQVHKAIRGIDGALGGLKGKLAGAFGGLAVGVLTKSMLDFGESIERISRNLDISTDSVQRFQNAMRHGNVDMGAFQKTMNTLGQSMGKLKGGSLDAGKIAALKKLGLGEGDVDLKNDALFFKALDNSKGLPRADVQQAFQTLGVKSNVASKIVGNREQILDQNGPVVTEENIKQLHELKDAFADLKTITMTALIPAFLYLTRAVMSLGGGVIEYWMGRKRKNQSLEDQAAADGHERPGMFSRFAAFTAENSLDTMKAMRMTEWNPFSDVAQKFLEHTVGNIHGGKNWQKYMPQAEEKRAELSQLEKNLQAAEERRIHKDIVPKGDKFDRPAIFKANTPASKALEALSGDPMINIGNYINKDFRYRLDRAQVEANALLRRIAEATEKSAKADEANSAITNLADQFGSEEFNGQ